MRCTRRKWSISSVTRSVSAATTSVYSGKFTIMLMALEAAFCSHQAWSVRISDIFFSTIFTQRGSVAIFNLKTPIPFKFAVKVTRFCDAGI